MNVPLCLLVRSIFTCIIQYFYIFFVFQLLFSQFRWIVKTHIEIIAAMNKAIGHNRSSSKVKLFYDEDFVWSRVQSVVR